MALTTAEVRARVATAIGNIAPAWRQSTHPPGMGPMDPGQFAHLAYSVWLPASDFDAARDSSRTQRGGTGGLMRTGLRVRWTYRLRADAAVADYDSALAAEAAVILALTGISALGGLHIAIQSAAREVVGDGTWLMQEISAIATHQIPIQ